jgi:plasmid stability protein
MCAKNSVFDALFVRPVRVLGQQMIALHAVHARSRYDGRGTATVLIRNLDDEVKRKLQVRAAMNGRSMEAEALAILTVVVKYVATAEMPGAEPAAPEKK